MSEQEMLLQLEKDPDLGTLQEGHICKHGIRYPQYCEPCAKLAYALFQLQSKLEGEYT